MSLSARRAWIEIKSGLQPLIASLVALRKESVDRNRKINTRGSEKMKSLSARRAWIEMESALAGNKMRKSLSARRAWIEISGSTKPSARRAVALRKESVDRNYPHCPERQ